MSAGSGGVNKRKSYKIDLSAAYLKCGASHLVDGNCPK